MGVYRKTYMYLESGYSFLDNYNKNMKNQFWIAYQEDEH